MMEVYQTLGMVVLIKLATQLSPWGDQENCAERL